MRFFIRSLLAVFVAGLLALGAFFGLQRSLLFFPSHDSQSRASVAAGLSRWAPGGDYLGYARLVAHPRKVWLYTHGNGGQAANREFVLPCFSDQDAVYILEYPGYGEKVGTPSRAACNDAALKAYRWLVQTYGRDAVLVLGESLGSGVASYLGSLPEAPKHIVLVVPFDVLAEVAQEKFPFLPVRYLLRDRWNNIEALQSFRGRLDIFGAKHDNVIPVGHARNLAARLPSAVYHEFDGDHGWANGGAVDLSQFE